MGETKEKPVVAIDSMTLVWGIRQVGSPEQLRRAKYLFDLLDDQGAQIIVPSVVVSEFLVCIEPERHAAIIATISSRFLIAPFDARCASLAATMFVAGKGGINKGQPNARICLKADCLVVATAVCHGAKRFYSGDQECRDRAAKYIEVRDLPMTSELLFDESTPPRRPDSDGPRALPSPDAPPPLA